MLCVKCVTHEMLYSPKLTASRLHQAGKCFLRLVVQLYMGLTHTSLM
jgi:hypothetical protein